MALSFWGAALFFAASSACAAEPTPPYEIIKSHSDVEVREDGSYAESRITVYRILTEQGVQALRQVTLSYSQTYQSYTVASAYTLKKDGTRIDVDPRGMLHGYGATSSPGFQDSQTLTVVFPNVEVGDQISMTTLFFQLRPWFGKSYSEEFVYGRQVRAHDVSISVTAPASMNLQVDAAGMTEVAPESPNGKTRRSWHFDNDRPVQPEAEAVDDYDKGARLVVSTFKDFHEFAAVYSDMIKDRAAITPAIQTLADQVTAGIKGDRDKARALYEWVSLHIGYVDIVLGAGGFVPHRAADVLANKYGDCKDHVILLQALLAAEDISSTPVLISADNRYTLSTAPGPQAFNHLITYIPEFHLYLDSTARYAPFGVLPFSDAGKPVVHIANGERARTPVPSAANATLRSVETVTIAPDGSVDGSTRVTATGAPAVDMRALVGSVKSVGDNAYFRQVMGPGVDGSIEQGNIDDLSSAYTFTVQYNIANALNIPGPAMIPTGVVYKPFAFTALLVGDMPRTRSQPYQCISMMAEEDLTIHLPDNVQVMALPHSEALTGEEIDLMSNITKPDARTIHVLMSAHVNHPMGSCTPDYYARVHSMLTKMASSLRSEILYQ